MHLTIPRTRGGDPLHIVKQTNPDIIVPRMREGDSSIKKGKNMYTHLDNKDLPDRRRESQPCRDEEMGMIMEEQYNTYLRLCHGEKWPPVLPEGYTESEPARAVAAKIKKEDVRFIEEHAGQAVYAEWASGGAMGCAGIERILMFRDGVLTEYTADIREDKRTHDAVYDIFEEKLRLERFQIWNAGRGNYVWKNRSVPFRRYDKEHGFVFEKAGKPYLAACSTEGVYQRTMPFLCTK